jgi:hypothetical protein
MSLMDSEQLKNPESQPAPRPTFDPASIWSQSRDTARVYVCVCVCVA